MTDDLVAFIEARLAEDEAVAHAATPGPWRVDDDTYAETIYAADDTAVVAGGRWGGEASVFNETEDALHIARHDPSRVLRDVAAKRRILDWAIRVMTGDYAPWNEDCIMLLALPYADHPDFRPEWSATDA